MKRTDYIRYLSIIMFGVGLLGYLIVNSWSLYSASYKNISVDQLAEMMNNKDFLLINVHIPYEGEISQTDLLIPFNAVEKLKNELPNDKDTKIVLYCMSGNMSRIAAEKLTSMGYTQVYNLQNGMKDWKRNGKQIWKRKKFFKN
ncbi:MAG: rhodanese-like domain-containing protein [Candidatus Desulfatibia sp.]|uniref:rhodanese-like domain-containing protein n=1 Tax=Candidatus Desulfatibia sp. TaxID=3101189 RepID=UPI002F32D871